MTGITQKIPNYIGGISQQPDELMPPGSVRDALNVLPDVTNGLSKRPGSRLVNPLLTSKEGTWFHIDRDAGEKYIGKINFDGTVDVFGVADGIPRPVYYKRNLVDCAPEPAYSSCDWDDVQQKWFDYQAAKDLYESKVTQLDDLKSQQSSQVTQERRTYYKVEKRNEYYGEVYTVLEGRIEKNGQDIYLPGQELDGWEYNLGNRMLSGVEARVFSVVDGVEVEQSYYPVDIWEIVFTRGIEGGIDYTEQIKTLEEEVKTLKEDMDQKYADYVAAATNCGITPRGRAVADSEAIPEYLKHNTQQQLQVLNINDYNIVVNPAIAVTMSKNTEEIRPSENYIEVITMAYAREYTLDIKEGDNPITETYNRVTKVTVKNSSFVEADASCPFIGTETVTLTGDGDRKNLALTVTVTGSNFQEGKNANSPSDYACRYRVSADVKFGGSGWEVGDIVTVTVSERDYEIEITEVKEVNSYGNITIHPDLTPVVGDAVLSAEELLDSIKNAIEAEVGGKGYTVEVIGGGIYISHPTIKFTVSTPETTLMKIITDQANDVTYLPTHCKDGYVVKVANTGSQDDDYYAKFVPEISGVDGAGVWEETFKPGIYTTFNQGTMPHKIVREANGSFTVTPIDWEPRLVGDDRTNPIPSFCSRHTLYPEVIDLSDEDACNEDRFINKAVFFRNRLTFLSGENAVASKPGDYFNFFASTALTISDNDPIDISASSTRPAVLLDAIEVAEGLLCFAPASQFLLSSDSELFSPRTARFNLVASQRYSGVAPAFSLGSTAGFLSNTGLHSRLLELTSVGRTKESLVNELSKPVSSLMPSNLNRLAASQDNNLVMASEYGEKDVWVYRYFDNDQQRVQSAWFRWDLLGDMVYHCIMDDVYWNITAGVSSSAGIPELEREIIGLQRIDLVDQLTTAMVYDKYDDQGLRDDNGKPFEAHLDNYRIAQPSEFTYYEHLNQTYFRAPLIYYKDKADEGRLVAYMLSPTELQSESEYYGPDKLYYFVRIGSMVPIRVEEDTLGTWFVMDGDWSNTRMMIGYTYDMKVDFPTFYPFKAEMNPQGGQSIRTDTRADLTVHRIKLNFGQTGVYETTLKRIGHPDYIELYECKTMDSYVANEIAFDQDKTQVVPCYSKNTNMRLSLKSSHPSPATLYSVEYEGNYNAKSYRKV